MSSLSISPRILGLVIGTRAALAFGVGLLVAEHIPESRRRTIAFTLIGIGAATTLPLAREVLASRSSDRRGRTLPEMSALPDPEAAPM
jgi:hypothetical protein